MTKNKCRTTALKWWNNKKYTILYAILDSQLFLCTFSTRSTKSKSAISICNFHLFWSIFLLPVGQICVLTFQIKLIKSSWYMERFLRCNQICDEKLWKVKIRKNKPKIAISLSQLLIIRDIQNLLLDISFCGWKMQLVKISLHITKDVKIQE